MIVQVISRRLGVARGWRLLQLILVSALFVGCDPGACSRHGEPGGGPGTPDFLDASDFDGSFTTGTGDVIYGGKSTFHGHLVFANLPRTVVENVLPDDLHLAPNDDTSLATVHPVLLLYGNHANTQWIFPFASFNVGHGYRELILLIPFVQKGDGSLWHNYVTRIYLDDEAAEFIGNAYFGYLKQIARLDESIAADVLSLEVFRGSPKVFEWTETPDTPMFVPSSVAETDLDNFANGVEILTMPILGTLQSLNKYVCSYWYWDLSGATVRPVDVSMRFVQEFRAGMGAWVSAGQISSVSMGAWEIRNVKWRMSFPPIGCAF